MDMNREVFQEGWLIKSPPTKRIWRARWRRRWFTLKQGEIPGQYCLEYYTDRNCRKLKGTIDLDQCEQVDCGLRLEHRKQKFQFMFDVKTPRRTFYLAAETEVDMHDWVNCICQVCNLQDLSKPSGDRNYYNIGHDTLALKGADKKSAAIASTSNNVSTEAQTSGAVSISANASSMATKDSLYENDEFNNRNSQYTNRDTVICDAKYCSPIQSVAATSRFPSEYYNFSPASIESSPSNAIEPAPLCPKGGPQCSAAVEPRSTTRRIPDNLKLTDTVLCSDELSPALSTASGPYISISECISGTSAMQLDSENPTTPLNSLDPRFYDTPRSRINIGLNLMTNEPPYSPKRYNYTPNRPKSGRSSPSDSESVFTDEEEWPNQTPTTSESNRRLRPSDSSIENDSMAYTYTQRFSKIPNDRANKATGSKDIVGPWMTANAARQLKADGVQAKDTQSSDTENASPAIGPKDASSCVEENYDIPRSHQLPYNNPKQPLSASTHLNLGTGLVATSTPNLSADIPPRSSKDARHFYTNAAPTNLEGNVFRYDFDEQEHAPKVNRRLKPKVSTDDNQSPHMAPLQSRRNTTSALSHQNVNPPSIDRKLKPYPNESFSHTLPRNYNQPGANSNTGIYNNTSNGNSPVVATPHQQKVVVGNHHHQPATAMPATLKPVLDYLELDTSNAPPICQQSAVPSSSGMVAMPSTSSSSGASSSTLAHAFGTLHRAGVAAASSAAATEQSGIVYKSVDFIKTEAIKRTRQDRAQKISHND